MAESGSRLIGQGESVEIACLTSGDPPPSVTWSRVGGELPITATVVGNGQQRRIGQGQRYTGGRAKRGSQY